MYKILVSDKLGQEGLDVLDTAEDMSYDLLLKKSDEELIAVLPAYDGWIVRSGTRPNAAMIAAGSKLKAIGRAGIGVDNIDIEAATENGVVVMNTPGANSMATAEQTLTLMLAVSRHTAHAHASVGRGEWNRSAYTGQELYNKTLGVIGFGKIGRLVTSRAQAFGMTVVAYDPYVSEEDARALDVTLVDLDDLFAQSNYITLHTAVTEETTNMINADAFAQMKDGVIIVNAARGKLIDEQALLDALESGKVAGAGLDVYQQEPPSADNPLIGHAKVTHVPHLGASSREAQTNVSVQIAEQMIDALRGDDIRNAVNVPFDSSSGFATIRPYLDLAEKLGHLQYHIATGDIERVEIDVFGEQVAGLVRPIAASILKGMISSLVDGEVNYVNAPLLANQLGIKVAQVRDLSGVDYPNTIACRIHYGADEPHTITGTVIGGKYPRIIKMSRYLVEGTPEGVVMLLRNTDVPGVVGQIGTLLAAYNINIAEWRMGRSSQGGEALCFINLDSLPPQPLVQAIEMIPAVTKAKVVTL